MVLTRPPDARPGEAAFVAYDEVAYPGYPYPQTHPDRLATLATLFGMKPPRVECCRVLELGCGDGGNLIPMAFSLPESEFVGIDMAARPLGKGQALVEGLGLKNITLCQLDLMDVPRDLGQFDYIIAHGLYSWVPPLVQDTLLAICKAHLDPNGVAYVSYNTYPGYHLQGMVRDMMRFHARQFAEPSEQVGQALALIKFLAEAKSEPDTYRALLKQILDQLLQRSEASLYHDELAEVNSPVYFYQFVERAGQHGLQYLSEANIFEMQDRALPPDVSAVLRQVPGDQIVLKEQYMDFLKGRKFRQTLLCHQDVSLDRGLTPEQMKLFYAASSARPVSSDPDIRSSAVEEFRGPLGASMSTGHPVAKAAILQLAEVWPQSLHFNELLSRVQACIASEPSFAEANPDEDALALQNILLATYLAGLIELHASPPQFCLEVSERPMASPLARLQLQRGTMVTTLRHTRMQVEDPLLRNLLLLLDGTRDRPALVRELAALVASGAAPMEREGAPVTDRETAPEMLADTLEPNLVKVGRFALLVA